MKPVWMLAALAVAAGCGCGAAARAQTTAAAQAPVAVPLAAPSREADIIGAWAGTLHAGAVNLRVVFHITGTAGQLTATLDSPDQNASGIPVSSVTRSGTRLTIEVGAVGGRFEGVIDASGSRIEGTWTQGAVLPLVLTRQTHLAQLSPPHPQNPHGPVPYRQQAVTFQDRAAGITLAGTLTVPSGRGPFPAVVLIAGSGPNDRDETVFGHKPFLVLADYLTRRHIAVLRYDKRGVGGSSGSEATATTVDFAADARAAFDYLRALPEIDARRVGLIGHSEGGVIAPMVAARDRRVAFVVLLAGPGVRGDRLLVAQVQAILTAAGVPSALARQRIEQERDLLAIVERQAGGGDAARQAQLRQQLSRMAPPARVDTAIRRLDTPWFRYFLRYDPAPALAKLRCPVLALFGGKDLQVPPALNLPAVRRALQAGGNLDFEVQELPGLNHLFQPARTGEPNEYVSIQSTMDPAALQTVATWILKHTTATRAGTGA